MSGLRCTVSAMRSERAHRSRSRRMDLVMRTRPMVVPGGQVTAELVWMAVSWNVLRKGAATCTGVACDGSHRIPIEGTSRNWENGADFEG